MAWALVLGAKGERPLGTVVEGLLTAGLSVGGFVREPVEVDGVRTGHVVRRFATGETLSVSASSPTPATTESFCGFHFDGAAFDRAREWLLADAARADVVVVDEVSKLEVAGRGHHAAVVDVLSGQALVVLVVRADQLFHAVERFSLEEPVATLDVGGAPAPFVAALAAHRAGVR